jgi:hypothetical protein
MNMILKSTGVIFSSGLTFMPNMKTVGQRNLNLLGGKAFFNQGPFDLDI